MIVVEAPKEAKELVEIGFEYVNDIDGKHIYRKRKT
jgi:dihydropteroate synthase